MGGVFSNNDDEDVVTELERKIIECEVEIEYHSHRGDRAIADVYHREKDRYQRMLMQAKMSMSSISDVALTKRVDEITKRTNSKINGLDLDKHNRLVFEFEDKKKKVDERDQFCVVDEQQEEEERGAIAISLPLAPSSNNDDGGVKEREQKIPVLVDEFDIL
jgi:hypothetical protein